MKETKILVVDDDAGISEMLQTLLELYNYKVFLTQNPHESVELAQKLNVNLIILDMFIGGVNGIDICSKLRNNKDTANIPILMMSALQDVHKKCIEAGAEGFIAKPFEIEDLLEKVNITLKPKA